MRLRLVNSCWLWVVSFLLMGCGSDLSDAGVTTAVSNPTAPPTIEVIPTVEPEATVTIAAPITLTWTAETGGPINHPPVHVNDVVIAVPNGGAVTALNIADGSIRWQFDPPERIWDRAFTSDGRFFFIGLENGKLIALDVQDGTIQWQKELGINAQTPLYFSEGMLYVPTTFVGPGLTADPLGQARLFALNPDNGTEIWAFESDNYILQTPSRSGDTVYVSGSYEADIEVDEGGPMRLYALAAADGAEKWVYESEDGYPKQLFANETAVTYIAYQDFVIGVDAATGQALWRRDTGNWVPTLSGIEDTIYFGSANTIVHALNVADGAVVWQYNIPEGTFNYVLGAPVRVDDTLYFLTQQGSIMALNARDGTLRWQEDTGIVAARTNPTISDNWMFLGDADGMISAYAINPSP